MLGGPGPPRGRSGDITRLVMLAVLFGEMSAAEAARWHGTSDMSVLKWKQLFLDAGAQVGQRVRG
ncbi:hypothetical protein [Rhodococcus pyridinivorans]|uniref:hypothetical protein n=1 Tax=Rhodococcus pyridinivorans TaxID=103816 RepID=UPI003AAED5D7